MQLSGFLIGLCLSAIPATNFAIEVQFWPDRDATLYEDSGSLANGSGDHLFFGKVGTQGDEFLRRALVRFDVSAIPAAAQIQSVEVAFEINQVPQISPAGGTATLHRVQADWGEGASDAPGAEGMGTAAEVGDATWLYRFYDSSFWTVPGGDFVSTPSASVAYGTGFGVLTFASTSALRADVQSWVRNPASNYGWMLRGGETLPYQARRVYARESVGEAVPLLTVNYVIPSVTDHLALTQVASGLSSPVALANAADGSGRLFIVEQAGVIRILDTTTGTLLATPYLDISGIVDSSQNEQGLLGLAFHPEFSSNRQFYLYYIRDPVGTNPDRSVVAMFRQSIANPNVAESAPTVLLEFEQDAGNHNGGDLHFGADGYLYIASGDGGGGGDQYDNAQNVDTLKGKILRIDVDGSPQPGDEICGIMPDASPVNYGIPPGNAFPGGNDGCDEILHLGLRNPWRFSFDAQTEEMYIGDVGQSSWEEIDYAAPGASGLNFGWPCFEGTHVFDAGATCPNPVPPIIEYPRLGFPNECAVTGGYVYRGSATALVGHYVYGDYCSARIWVARRDGGTWSSEEWAAASTTLSRITAFGQDAFCELYVADAGTGRIYRIDDTERVARSGFEALRCQ
jgi:glucose/arabinose dehydrogenase